MNTEDITSEFKSNTEKVLAWADKLSAEQLAQQPKPGKWSVLEVLEHIFIVEKSAVKLASIDCENVERDLEKSMRRMANGMADTTQAYFGGNIVDPKGRFANYAEWLAAFVATRGQLVQLAEEKGWMGLCIAAAHPYFGHLTRAEWVIMCGLHADRHLGQMQGYVN